MIDFWFTVGSTYTALTVGRLARIVAQEDVAFRWRPFNVRVIMLEQKNLPFSTNPVKAAYMWRDIERRAARYGVPVRVPAPYPAPELELANRVAIVGAREGWISDYVTTTYRHWFVEGHVVGSEPNISTTLGEIGEDAARVVSLAQSEEVGAELRDATDEARRLKIFGSPTFVARGDLFWGDDRLEDAIAWERKGTLVTS